MSDVQIKENEEDLENQETEIEDSIEGITDDFAEETEGDSSREGDFFSVWDESVVVNRLKLLAYGVSGSGKSTLAASFPKPIFLDLEGGMLSVRKFKPMRFPKDPKESVKSYVQVVQFFNLVKSMENPPFETIVIDSLNELQLLIAQYMLEKYSNVRRQYGDQLTLADYG